MAHAGASGGAKSGSWRPDAVFTSNFRRICAVFLVNPLSAIWHSCYNILISFHPPVWFFRPVLVCQPTNRDYYLGGF
jgi:hypothetical protein